jgi:hypothetical protein
MKLKHLLIMLAVLLAVGLILVEYEKEPLQKKIIEPLTLVHENGSISVYFCPQEDCNTVFAEEIYSAKNAECAFYELNDQGVKDALAAKNASVIIHYENFRGFGIPRNTSGLMHNKFCVLDGEKIFSGSHNPTINENKDNILVIDSKYLAENYDGEFTNLESGLLGAEKKKAKYPRIIFNGYELDNYFCPQDSCQKHILDELKTANSSVYFLTYTFTDKEIAKVLADKKAAGLDVRGVIEGYQGRTYWVYPALAAGGVPVVLDNEKTLQHNKVFIIDNSTVITGSFNPTRSADTVNDENVIILRQPGIVDEYIEEFNYLYAALNES